ncbi:hypothetical protein OZX72_01455 [Bifidobacterium sp. ESL0769]|uniref:hypothetical protein n=1 Tax=Bifidobacterium sp. ESL0769 TaxID=2983229 RepID=UPI0023F9B672|nr:hypothetical protein [Bifidobacterium sp. ESL0769]WEV67696.1 hypothetical protein OZX72_01455 [Bifidobacterium sp. ESL0769]
MLKNRKDSDGPEVVQAFAVLLAALAARADNAVADILLVALTGCVLARYWMHRRE